jgi:hypothetical protein
VAAHDAVKGTKLDVRGSKSGHISTNHSLRATPSDDSAPIVTTDVASGTEVKSVPVSKTSTPTSNAQSKSSVGSATPNISVESAPVVQSAGGSETSAKVNGGQPVTSDAVETKGSEILNVRADLSITSAAQTMVQSTTSAGTNHSVGQILESRNIVSSTTTARAATDSASHVRDGSAELAVRSYEAPASNQLEIGLSGGSFGWLKVRAELTGSGEIHAYLRGTSANAEETLRAQSSQMATYLSSQEVRMNGLHVETTRSLSSAGDMSAFAGEGGSSSNQNPRNGTAATTRQMGTLSVDEAGLQSVSALPIPAMLNSGSLSGGWLSVRV